MRAVMLVAVIVASMLVGIAVGNGLAWATGMKPLDSPVNLRVIELRHWLGLAIGVAGAAALATLLTRRWREQDTERAMFRRARTEQQIRSIKY